MAACMTDRTFGAKRTEVAIHVRGADRQIVTAKPIAVRFA
jgi:hypothetical protein